jgi:hypothetical protein
MNDESKVPINRLVFLGRKPNDDGLDPRITGCNLRTRLGVSSLGLFAE